MLQANRPGRPITQEHARLLLRSIDASRTIEFEYYETVVQSGGVEPDPYDAPLPPGDGWALVERLPMGSLLVFRWQRRKR